MNARDGIPKAETDRDGLRVPPQALGAEAALLGAVLLDAPATWPDVAATLTTDHFFDHRHKRIFGAMAALIAEGDPVDIETVHARLDKLGKAEEADSPGYLAQLAQFVPNAGHRRAYAKLVREAADRRRAIEVAENITAAAFAGAPLTHIVAQGIEHLGHVAEGNTKSARMDAVCMDLTDLALNRAEPPAFIIPEWLPAGCVTLLAAHGEGGKSFLALFIATCLAAGLPVLGQPAGPPRRVLFYSAEDGLAVLRWRLQQYCAALSISPADLVGKLHVVDADQLEAPELFVEDRDSVGRLTETYAALEAFIGAHGIEVAVIDNASDVYAANEVSRPAVRAFLRSLRKLLRGGGDAGAVLLLAHVNRAASTNGASGQQYSGSTAWHNSVRSRLELTRGKATEADDDHDEDATPKPYVLKRAKGNHAAPDAHGLTFHWNHLHGVILPEHKPGPLVQAIDHRNAEREVLAALAEAHTTGQRISPNVKANNCAAKVFKDMGVALPPRLRDMKALAPVLRHLQHRGWLAIETYTDENRKKRERWALTEAGMAEATQ